MLRLAQALDLFKPGLGDVAMILALILDAMKQAVSRLYTYENREPGEDAGKDAAA